MPSASSLLFSRLSARSTGAPFRTMTSASIHLDSKKIRPFRLWAKTIYSGRLRPVKWRLERASQTAHDGNSTQITPIKRIKHKPASASSAVCPLRRAFAAKACPFSPKLARGRRLGLFGSDFALEAGFAPAAGAGPPQDNGRGNEDGGVGPDDYPDDNSERKVAQDGAAEQEQTQNRYQRDGAGKDSPAQ